MTISLDGWAAHVTSLTHTFGVDLTDTPPIIGPYGKTPFLPRKAVITVQVIAEDGYHRFQVHDMQLKGPVQKNNGLPGQREIEARFWGRTGRDGRRRFTYDGDAPDPAFITELASWAVMQAEEL